MLEKSELRKLYSAIRANEKDKAVKDALIAERLLANEKIVSADGALVYSSIRSEIDTSLFIERLWSAGKPVYFPLCREGGEMTFHKVSSADELSPGSYGILEPSPKLSQPEVSERTACILPGLAFTEDGGRLGYGGGFYDRFLMKYPQIYTIALSYESLIAPELPTLEHDLRARSIITEERTIICNE